MSNTNKTPQDAEFRTCTCCGNTYPNTEEYFNKNGKYLRSVCKKCKAEENKKRYEKSKELFSDYHIEYDGEKICNKCGRLLPNSYRYFPVDKSKNTGLRNICRECDPKYKGGFLPEDYVPPRKWSLEDDKIFMEYYKTMTCDDFRNKFFVNDSIESIMHHADFLNVTGKTQEAIKAGRKIAAEKTSNALLGVCFSDEHKKALSISKINYFKTHDSWTSGDKNPFWKGGISPISKYLRCKIVDWKRSSAENCHFKCVICGDVFHNIHHVFPYHKMLNSVFEKADVSLKNNISCYTEEEIKILNNELLKLHNMCGYGACLNKKIHTLFHNEYGRNNFNEFDFLDFVYRIDCGEFDKWFEENNLDININYEYIEYLEGILTEMNCA